MNDFFRLFAAAFGGAKTIAAIGVEEYGRLLKRAFRPSVYMLAAAITLVWLSEVTDSASFNMLAVLMIGVVLIAWMVLALPVFAAVELAQSIAWEPVRRIISRFSSVLCAILVFAVIALRLPAGFDGVTWAGIIFTIFLGLTFFGLKISKTFLAVQLIGAGLFAAAGLLIPPQIAGGLTDVIEAQTTRIGRDLSGRPGELNISLTVLTGADPAAPLLYDLKGREPRWWCRVAPEASSGIRCYDRPGRDPFTKDMLIPINPDMVEAAISRLRMKESNERAAEIERLASVERDQLARAEALRAADEEKRQEDVRRFRSANLNLNGTTSNVAWNVRAGQQFERLLEDQLREAVGVPASTAFRDAALSNGVFGRVLNGDAAEIERLGLAQVAPLVIVGDLNRMFTPNAAIPGSGSLQYQLRLVCIDTATGSILFTENIDAVAAGQSERIAEGRARAILIERAGNQLKRRLNN